MFAISAALVLALVPSKLVAGPSRAGGVAMSAEPTARRSVLASAALAATSAAAWPVRQVLASDDDGAWAEHAGPFDAAFFQGFETTPSGFVFKKVYVPDPPTAKPARPQGTKMGPFQKCFVHYSGYKLDGTKFDSS